MRSVPSERAIAAPTGRQTALIAVGQGATMVLGGVLALLIAQIFGKNSHTDAFFAAYGVYSIGITFTGSFRLTAVSWLVEDLSSERITRLIGAVLLICVVVALPMVLLADLLGPLLAADDPTGTAATGLRILWIALSGQLLAAALQTALTVRGAFEAVAFTSVAVGFVSLGTFVGTEWALGIDAAAVGLTAGSAWLAGVLALLLMRRGWRPTLATRPGLRGAAVEAWRLAYASSAFAAATFSYVIAVSLAAREGPGEATLFAYAYVLTAILLGVTVNVSAMARSPSLAASSERQADTAATAVGSFRFTVVLAGPVLGMALLIGQPVVGLALGSDFADADIDAILVTLVCLLGWFIGTAAGLFAVVELLARNELHKLALLALAQVAAMAGAAWAGAAVAGIEGIAVGLSLVTLAVTAVQLRWAFGDGWLGISAQMASAAAREVAIVALAFAPSVLLLEVTDGLGSTLAAAVVATALAALATRLAWPQQFELLRGVLRRSAR